MNGIELSTFLRDNASAVFGLLGAVAGVSISEIAGWFGRKHDYDLRLWDKLLERRIRAHEAVLTVATEMRVMIPLGGIESPGEIARSPQLLSSKELFEDWWGSRFQQASNGSAWLTTEVRREMNFIQDYLVTLHHNLAEIPSEKYRLVGRIIRQDFIDLSAALEKKAFRFFEKEVRKLRLSDIRAWHKHPREETEKRLNETELMRRWSEVEKFCGEQA